MSSRKVTVKDSISWMKWDFPFRIVPMIAIPAALILATPLSAKDIGLYFSGVHPLVPTILIGIIMGVVSWVFRVKILKWNSSPTTPDVLLETTYYCVLNSPAEELVFRGIMIGLLGNHIGNPTALFISTLVFGAYHIPAKWGSKAVAGVTAAGFLFGCLFLITGESLIAPMIVHAFATSGLLSAGPWMEHILKEQKVKTKSKDAEAHRYLQ